MISLLLGGFPCHEEGLLICFPRSVPSLLCGCVDLAVMARAPSPFFAISSELPALDTGDPVDATCVGVGRPTLEVPSKVNQFMLLVLIVSLLLPMFGDAFSSSRTGFLNGFAFLGGCFACAEWFGSGLHDLLMINFALLVLRVIMMPDRGRVELAALDFG